MAATRESVTYWHFSQSLVTRRGSQLILRGVKIYKGALVLFHNGRAMPAGSFNNSSTILAGGPLSVAGADGNGGLRLISREANVQFIIAAGTLAVRTVYSGGKWLISVKADTTTNTAFDVVNAVRGHAHARQLVDIVETGTGLGLVALFGAADVPQVTVAGICKRTIDNSSDASNDLDVTNTPFFPLEFDLGAPYMVPDGSGAPTAAMVGGSLSVKDDWTVSSQLLPLQVALPFVDMSPERGPAINLLARPQ